MFDESGELVAHPLKTWDDVQNWTPDDAELYPVVQLKRQTLPNRHRTLICHDLAGGYLQDRYVQGCKDYEAYRFYHWQYVDIFVYFSHCFVTIPPPGWINAAHTHGTPILGTIITEWDEGQEMCKTFLRSQETYEKFAEKLVQIAIAYGFEGWLINIENKLEADTVENLEGFVKTLTEKMHHRVEHSCVIWYDSVIKTGELKWQNRLNDLNCNFFDACDGIFLNYTWKDKDLDKSKEMCLSKGRPYDVYVGADVFGRGCRGGGGYNTKEAVKAARNLGLSVALFAPGWVYENQNKNNFTANENKFWSLLHEVCPMREHKGSGASELLKTNFCQGRGKKLFCEGQVVSEEPWSNLSAQSLQPNYTNSQFSEERDQQKMSICLDDGYHGGGCLRLTGVFTETSLLFRLFKTDVDAPRELQVCWAYKSLTAGNEVAVKLTFSGPNGETVHCYCGSNQLYKAIGGHPAKDGNILSVNRDHKFIHDWQASTCNLDLPADGFRLKEVSLEVFRKDRKSVHCNILLGILEITPKPLAHEVLLVSNIQSVQLSVGVNKTEQHKEDISVAGDKAENERFCTLVKWTYPEDCRMNFHIYLEHADKTGSHVSKLTGQTCAHHFVISHSQLASSEAPIHVEIVPVRFSPWQKQAGPYTVLIKDTRLAQ